MTPPDRLGEIEALEKMLEADGALYPTYANKLIAIARRQMERADKAERLRTVWYSSPDGFAIEEHQSISPEKVDAYRRQAAKDLVLLKQRAERAEARLAEREGETGTETIKRLRDERDAARADAESRLQSMNGWHDRYEKARAEARDWKRLREDEVDAKERFKAEAGALRAAAKGVEECFNEPQFAEERVNHYYGCLKVLRDAAGAAEADCDCDLNASEGKHDASCQSPKGQSGEGAASKPMIQTPAPAKPAKKAYCPKCGNDYDGPISGCTDGCVDPREPAPAPPEACPGAEFHGPDDAGEGAVRFVWTVEKHCPACPSHKEASR